MTKPTKKVSSKDCLFCHIAKGQIPTRLRYKDSEMVAFDDIHPHAPIHLLVVPKKHIASLATASDRDKVLLGKLLHRCKKLAEKLNIADSGYRVVINVGPWGGQVVPHLHVHLLGGAPLSDQLGIRATAKAIGQVRRV